MEANLQELLEKAETHVPTTGHLSFLLSEFYQESRELINLFEDELVEDEDVAVIEGLKQDLQLMRAHIEAMLARVIANEIPVGRIAIPRTAPAGFSEDGIDRLRRQTAEIIAQATFMDLSAQISEATEDVEQLMERFVHAIKKALLHRANRKTRQSFVPIPSRN